jgi:MSHA biogenesis protein MshP
MKKQIAGFYIITAVFFLVVLSLLSAYMLRFGLNQQNIEIQDILSSKAFYAARAGTEWGLFQATRNLSCPAASTNFSPGNNLSELTITVTTSPLGPYDEGGTMLRVCNITATACNVPVSGACPGNSQTLYYIERQLTASVSY